MKNNPYRAYKQQSILTMTPGDMLTTVYDGLLKELASAQVSFNKNDISEINRHLKKAQLILKHLQNSLDSQYEVSENLYSLYDYFTHIIIQANIKKDPSSLDEIITMISELRNTYIQADKQTRSAENLR